MPSALDGAALAWCAPSRVATNPFIHATEADKGNSVDIVIGSSAAQVLCEPFPRLFCRSSYWYGLKPWVRPYQIIRTLARARDDLVFCSVSAACVLGLPVSLDLLGEIHIAVPPGGHGGRRGPFVRHAMQLDKSAMCMGVCITPLEKTVADCMCQLSFGDGLAIVDGALRRYRLNRARLAHVLAHEARHSRGVVKARRVLRYADARSGSGGESKARAVMIEDSFMPPDLQIELPDVVDARRSYYADGGWRLEDGRLIVYEMDGLEKYLMFSGASSREDASIGAGRGSGWGAGDRAVAGAVRKMMRERQREARLTAVCDGVIRFDYDDVLHPESMKRVCGM